jgi:hypothetical protein
LKQIALAVALLGVTPAMSDEYHSVSWYEQHPVERTKTLHWCGDNIGLAKHMPVCENALQAADLGRLKQLSTPVRPAPLPANPDTAYWRWCHSLGAANPCGN